LGTAQDAGYPQIHCQKECCAKVLSGEENPEWVSCLALVDPGKKKYWLFDATPSIVEQTGYVQKLIPGISLAGIFLTHAHIGHYTGLMMLGREAWGAGEVPVYVMPRMRTFLESNGPWGQLVSLNNIQIRDLQNEEEILLPNDVSVTPFLVPHRDEYSETVGFQIKGPGQTALFIPDIDKWEKWDKDIQEEVAEVDIAFLDATFYANGEIPGRDMSEIPHPFVEETMKLFEGTGSESKIHFIHLNHTNPLLWSVHTKVELEAKGFEVARTGQQFPF
ncbi:MAG: MBL fold metallo-hydrolase, partial [Saprospiraceae bacterium]|nr:MBL fold metallo-hydrolase [Saprospiraceae bacterium]